MKGRHTVDYTAFGRRVRQQRILNNLTQEELAELSGISCSFVGHIERGEKKASIETVVSLSNALKVSPSVLLQDSLNPEVLQSQLSFNEANQAFVNDLMHVLREHNKQDNNYI